MPELARLTGKLTRHTKHDIFLNTRYFLRRFSTEFLQPVDHLLNQHLRG
jgi:hypothetical protein